MKELIDRLSRLLKPYLPEQKGQVFFKSVASIEESERSKETRSLYGDDSHKKSVMSRGIILDTEQGNHSVLYEHSHRMENGYNFHTILGRNLVNLSEKELNDIYNDVSSNVEKGKVFPAIVTEGYDENIGDEDHTYFSVVFDKPFDEEQESIADLHNCETINHDKSDYIFMDYDDAIGFAYDNSCALEKRGNFRRKIGSDDWPVFTVTFESSDPRLKDIASRHHGDTEYTKSGNPLVIASFNLAKDARAYREEVKTLLSTENTIKVRTDITEHDFRLAQYQAKQAIHERIVSPSARTFTPDQLITLNHYRGLFSAASSTEIVFKQLFDDVIKQDDVSSKPEQWKKDTWNEMEDIAKGITHDSVQGLKR